MNVEGTISVVVLVLAVGGAATAQPNEQELWEETTTIVRPTSYWRTEVEVTRSRQTRTTSGAPVGAPTPPAPSTFSLEQQVDER